METGKNYFLVKKINENTNITVDKGFFKKSTKKQLKNPTIKVGNKRRRISYYNVNSSKVGVKNNLASNNLKGDVKALKGDKNVRKMTEKHISFLKDKSQNNIIELKRAF